MATIREETLVSNPLGHSTCPWDPVDDGHIDLIDAFFEASSPRKVMGKYVYVYSKRYEKPVPELGVFGANNGFLSYRFSDSPFGPFREGGDISFNGGEILHDAEGLGTMTYQWGNNHGSIMEVNGQWYVFYHRQTGVNEYSRQAMLEPIDVAIGRDGNLYIGKIRYLSGEPVSSTVVEMTSQGAHINGLDARKWISAGYACHIYGSRTRAYIRPGYEETCDISTPVVNMSSGTTVGFRYLQFGQNTPKTVTAVLGDHKALKVNVRLDSYKGKIVASFDAAADATEVTSPVTAGIVGRHAVYFEFICDEEGAVAEFDRFTFD